MTQLLKVWLWKKWSFPNCLRVQKESITQQQVTSCSQTSFMRLMRHLMRMKAGLESVSGLILNQTPDEKLVFFAAFICLGYTRADGGFRNIQEKPRNGNNRLNFLKKSICCYAPDLISTLSKRLDIIKLYLFEFFESDKNLMVWLKVQKSSTHKRIPTLIK